MIPLAPGVAVGDGELVFRAVRSGGPGGQNVNKVATRVELVFDVAGSPSLEEKTRRRLLRALKSRLDSSGKLRLTCSSSRSQARNRELVTERLRQLVTAALRPRKKRQPTRPTRAAREQRLREKRARSDLKRQRRAPPD